MLKRFEVLTKKLSSYSRELFTDIYEVIWDKINNKPKILNPGKQGEFKLFEFAQKYYSFLVGQNQFEINEKDRIKISNKKIDKLNVAVDSLKEHNCCFALDSDGAIKGFCGYLINKDKKEVDISILFTAKEYQRQGVAKKLLHYVEKKAILKYKCDTMKVSVLTKNNNAKAFYNNFGLKPKNNIEEKSMENIKILKSPMKYRFNNKNTVRIYRNYKCLDCGQRFEKFDQLLNHAKRYHKDLIGDQDPYRYLYEKRNPGPYICIICHKRQRSWNDKTHKYNRICDNPECIKKSREIFSKNMKRIYGTDNLAKNPEYQARIMANRHIAGRYKFKDGNEIPYIGSYEEDFLKHCEEKFGFNSMDITEVPSKLYIKYFDPVLNRDRWYIQDFFLPKYNLVIEIKDASKYPVDSKALMILKENAVIKANKFNYIKIVEKDYRDFDDFIESFSENHFSIEKHDINYTIIIPETN